MPARIDYLSELACVQFQSSNSSLTAGLFGLVGYDDSFDPRRVFLLLDHLRLASRFVVGGDSAGFFRLLHVSFEFLKSEVDVGRHVGASLHLELK
jgi:hypothetical protein